MVLNRYVELKRIKYPVNFQGIAIKFQFSKATKELFVMLEKTKNEIQLDSKNYPMALPVYSVISDVCSIYNSDKDDLVMLQELFDRLEEIRDNEQKELAARWYAEELHNQLSVAFEESDLLIITYN